MARKTVNGKFRNKERTMSKLINAVGEVIQNQGYFKLGVNNIARTAGVNKKLIYKYFGNVESLIKSYIMERDYWLVFNEQLWNRLLDDNLDHGKELNVKILIELFKHLSNVPEAQKIILWEISENSSVMREINRFREHIRMKLFSSTGDLLSDTSADIEAMNAIILGGIYYLHLRTNAIGGICNIDIRTIEGEKRILDALTIIVELMYNEGRKQKLTK